MGRRRSAFARAIDLKPKAFFLFERLSRLSRRAPFHLGFFPQIRPFPVERFSRVLLDCTRPSAVQVPPYASFLGPLAVNDWDVRIATFFEKDEFRVRELIGILPDVIVPGHTLTPVDPLSLAQFELHDERKANWNFAHPAPIWLRRRDVGGVAVIVPPHANYAHLLLDVLLPIAEALERGAVHSEPVTILTHAKRPAMVDAFAQGLARLGHRIEVMELSPFEHARVERLLVAQSRCRNVERSWPMRGATPALRRVFEAAYGPTGAEPAPRLYLTRGGSRLRRLLNEDELMDGLRARGFSVLEATWRNHAEQIARFTAASFVVGVHGAGLANVLWMRPEAQLLEIFPSTFRKTTYLNICAEQGVGYDLFLASDEGHLQSFSIDCVGFFAKLDAMLAAERPHPPSA